MLSSASRVGLGSRVNVKQLSAARSFLKTIPQPPGGIVGTVNDAFVPPPAAPLHGSKHWTFERIVVLGMAPLMTVPLITGESSMLLDSAMSSLLLYHCYAGFQSCIIDYIPKRVYGSIHDAVMWLLLLGTGVCGYGIYKIENEEKEGVWGVLKKLWRA
ncbi:succinate dehydrogenase membrane anchor subunit [Martiniozyma asiatica (nom. inval.)]|nr:succinate dehydrogenase membrane anchor subunit [Martiniozyma asiatica]